MKFRGVLRAARFSPNSSDLPIMQAVARGLERRGGECQLTDEDELPAELSDDCVYFTMARSEAARKKLAGLSRVVNSTEALAITADRFEVCRLLQRFGVGQPEWRALSSEGRNEWRGICWLKTRSGYTTEPSDVCFVETPQQEEARLQSFKEGGICEVLEQAHAAGDLVKFYSVAGTPFFHCSYPTEQARQGKFGLEVHNGKPRHYTFAAEALKQTLDRAALAVGLMVYGADVVVFENGEYQVVDLNDWPSFSTCIDKAAPYIVELLLNL